MSSSQAAKIANRELQDLFAKLRFAFVSLLVLPAVGATLTTLRVPRSVAAVVVFAGFAILLLAFVVARGSESRHLTPEAIERKLMATAIAKLRYDIAAAQPLPARGRLTLRVINRLAGLFYDKPSKVEARP